MGSSPQYLATKQCPNVFDLTPFCEHFASSWKKHCCLHLHCGKGIGKYITRVISICPVTGKGLEVHYGGFIGKPKKWHRMGQLVRATSRN